ASSTSSIAKTLPTQLTTTRRSPAGTEQGWKESDPRARSDNAQPHHRLPGSNSKTGSLRQESPTSASDRTRFSRTPGRAEGTTKLKGRSRNHRERRRIPTSFAPLGMHALQTNTVRQHLGLGDAPPTA